MAGSSFARRVYGLLVEKSLMDDTDLEIVEESCLGHVESTSSSFKAVTYASVIAAVAAGECLASYQLLMVGLLLSPAFYIGFLEIAKCIYYNIVKSYADESSKFDAIFHQVIAAVRSREITFFRLRKKYDINITVCLRSFRCKLLRALRSAVQSHMRMSKSFCRHNDSGKLLCDMFAPEMSRLALQDDVCDEFLQLSSLKELWQLLFLLRSEYLRIFLFHLMQPSYKLILLFLDLLRKIWLMRSSNIRLSSDLHFIDCRSSAVEEKKIHKFSSPSSTATKVLQHLSFASEIMNGEQETEDDRFTHVAAILKETIELLAFNTNIKHRDTKCSNISLSLSASTSEDEAEPTEDDELPIEKLYEGSPIVSDDEQQDVLFSSWEEEKSNDAARSVVMELKARLNERSREMGAAKVADSAGTQKMVLESEFEKRLTNDRKYVRSEQLPAEKDPDQSDIATFKVISGSNPTVQSQIGIDLKRALSFRKLAPSVCFTDDPENQLSSSGTES